MEDSKTLLGLQNSMGTRRNFFEIYR